VDWQFIAGHYSLYITAGWLTLRIAVVGILLSLLIGTFCSLAQYLKIPVIRAVVSAYIELARNTPLIVQLFLLYFGLPKLGIKLSGEACALCGMAFLGGAYMAEVLRSGLAAVEKTQYESALSLGLSRSQAMRHVMFPQGLAVAVPGVAANVIFLIKETSVFSVVALADLMFTAKDLIGLHYATTEALFMLVTAYLIILLPISLFSSLLEGRLRHAGFAHSV